MRPLGALRLAALCALGVVGLSPERGSAAGAGAAKVSIQADEAPTSKPWTEPARLAYTINTDGRDSFSVDIATRMDFPIAGDAPIFGMAELVWHKNNQQKKKQDDLRAAVGLHFEMDTISATGPLNPNAWSLFVDGKIGYGRKALFADLSKPACQANPDAVFCGRQFVESIRGTLDISPFHRMFESEQPRRAAEGEGDPNRLAGPPIAYSLGVFATAFVDDITRNAVDPDDGTIITGTVTGLRGKAGIALSPRFADYRFVLRISGQVVQATSRAAARAEDFPRSSPLFTASLDYDFVQSSLLNDEARFRPSVGVTYTTGSDPLAGRAKQSTVVLALKIAFK